MASSKKLSAVIQIGGTITSSLRTAFGDTQKNLRAIGDSIRRMDREQRLMAQGIQTFGRMGRNVDGLRDRYSRLTEQMDRARRAQERLQNAAKFRDRMGETGGKLRSVAAKSAGAGLAIGGVLAVGVKAAIHRENAVAVIQNSGVSKADADAMVNAAQNSKQFGVSVTKATDTVSELRTALGSAHHAIEALPTALKAISGLQLYDRLHHSDLAGGDSAYQLAKVADERGGAKDPAAMRDKFNWAFRGLTGSNGKITVADQLTAVRSGKGAVQAMSDEAFFGDTFLQQSMGANRYGTASSTLVNAWIGGHQTHGAFDHMLQLGLLNRKGVKFDKTGKVKTVSPDALVDAQLFLKDPQKWSDKHLTPLAQKRGVNVDDPAAVMAFVNSITSNPNAANLLLSRIRFRSNIWKDRQNVMQAHGIDESDKANQKSTAGKMDNARARLDDAETRVGTVLIPAFATAMEHVATELEAVNKFADENPRLMKAVVIGLGALAGGLIVAAPLLVTASGILQTIALMRLARAASGVASVNAAMDSVPGAASRASRGILGFLGKLGMAAGLSSLALEAAKALGLPDTDKKLGEDDVKNGRWLDASTHLPALEFGKAVVHRLFGSDNDKPQPGHQLPGWGPRAGMGVGLPSLADNNSAPPPPLPALNGRGGNTVQVTNHNTITIHAQPGQSSTAIANDVMAAIAERDRQDRRSSFYDLVGQ